MRHRHAAISWASVTTVAFAATLLYGCASGPAGVRPEIRNDAGHEPSVTGTSSTVTLTFEIRDDDFTACSVRIECFVGGAWRDATLAAPTSGSLAGSVIEDLAPRDTWLTCTVSWDSWADDAGKSGASPPTTPMRFTPYDIDGEGQAVEIQAPIDNYTPQLVLLETTISFEYGLDSGVNPADQSIHIQNAGPAGTALSWARTVSYVSGTPGWLTATPASGTTTTGTDTIVLAADPDGFGLSAGARMRPHQVNKRRSRPAAGP